MIFLKFVSFKHYNLAEQFHNGKKNHFYGTKSAKNGTDSHFTISLLIISLDTNRNSMVQVSKVQTMNKKEGSRTLSVLEELFSISLLKEDKFFVM